MNKWSTAFEPVFYTITGINGSSIVARRITDGRDVCFDASQFKLANALIEDDPSEKLQDKTEASDPEEWRQENLRSVSPHSDVVEMAADKDQTVKSNGVERTAPTKLPAEVRPKRSRQRPCYLMDYVF